MNERDLLTRLLGGLGELTPAARETLALLAEYVEGELEGRNVRSSSRPSSSTCRNCPACAEDYEGLVALAREQGTG